MSDFIHILLVFFLFGMILSEDLKIFKNLTNLQDGKPFNFAGFNMLQFSKTPRYTKVGGV